MTGRRAKYSGDFKAKVALEAIKGEMTLAQLAAKHGVHQTLIENMVSAFSGKANR
jgi:transposase